MKLELKFWMVTIVGLAVMCCISSVAVGGEASKRATPRPEIISPEPVVAEPLNEVYISSARLSRSYMTEAIKALEQAGYTITTRSKGALRLRISFMSVREGGGGILSGRYRVRGGIRSRVYFCSAFLTDPDGRVVARGEGESLYSGNYQIPLSIGRKSGSSQTFGLRWDTSTSEAKASAALKAITGMLQNRVVSRSETNEAVL